MKHEEVLALASAFEEAIPFFKADKERISELFGSNPSDVSALDELLGDGFCAYVELKEFDSWGIESLNELIPLTKTGITLSIDELYESETVEEDMIAAGDPYEYFMPALQDQLAPHNLELLEICTVDDDDGIIGNENPHLVCVRAEEGCVEKLNALLQQVGLALC